MPPAAVHPKGLPGKAATARINHAGARKSAARACVFPAPFTIFLYGAFTDATYARLYCPEQ